LEITILSFKKTIVIIPTYNEISNVKKMVSTIFNLYKEISLLIVDDGGPDGTKDAVVSLQNTYPNLHLIARKEKMGLASAYIAGFKWVLERDYDFIFQMDCDFSHSPEDISMMLESAQDNDLVIGSRYIDGIRIINWPFKRLLLSYLASLYTRFVTNIPLYDTTGGFKCFKKNTLLMIKPENAISSGYIFLFELSYRVWASKLSIKEVPIIFHERTKGKSKMSDSIIFEAFFAVIKLKLLNIFGKLDNKK
jgi:dolichol-phosphate mannosyltransferase